jgi:hypothetical protein
MHPVRWRLELINRVTVIFVTSTVVCGLEKRNRDRFLDSMEQAEPGAISATAQACISVNYQQVTIPFKHCLDY